MAPPHCGGLGCQNIATHFQTPKRWVRTSYSDAELVWSSCRTKNLFLRFASFCAAANNEYAQFRYYFIFLADRQLFLEGTTHKQAWVQNAAPTSREAGMNHYTRSKYEFRLFSLQGKRWARFGSLCCFWSKILTVFPVGWENIGIKWCAVLCWNQRWESRSSKGNPKEIEKET